MGLTQRLVRFAFSCPRPLLAVAPGGTACRLAVERELRALGGRQARNAAEADTLLVCGSAGTELSEALDLIWSQLPVPKARVAVTSPEHAHDALAEARARLHDIHAQRGLPVDKPPDTAMSMDMNMDMSGMDMEAMMMGPFGGLPVARRAADRDGLMLDQWQLRLGPVLPDWPAGLVLSVTTQGDVIQQAEVEVLAAAPGVTGPSFWHGVHGSAAGLDGAARLLSLAGLGSTAARARRLRDAIVDGQRPAGEMVRAVRGSRMLRWLLAGVGEYSGGDAWTRLLGLLDGAPRPDAGEVLAALPEVVTGLDLATARLAVASLDPDLDELLPVRSGVAGG